MTLAPFLDTDPVIQVHILAGVLGVLLGPFALYLRQGTRMHKTIGYLWVLAMAVLAIGSFAIHGFGMIGPFSPLHGLALLTLWSLVEGIRRARTGDTAGHRRVFQALYWYGLFIAALFTLLPGRSMNRILFPAEPDAGLVLIGAGLAVLGLKVLRQWRRRRSAA